MPAELLACMHERFAAEGSDEPDTSRYQQIEQFTVSLSPDDSAKGLAFGLSIGSTPDGTFQKIKAEEIENYLTALAEENRKRPRGEEQGQIEEQPARSPTDAVSSDTQSQSPESENASSSEDAEASDGSAQRKGDGEGILPPGAPPWLSRLAQMVLAYFGLDAYSHYFAMAMMMVAPDLMEQVAAFSASLTDGLASDDLDKAFEKLHEAFKLAMAVSSTVSGIRDALGEESMAEIVTEIAKEIQQMPPALRRDLGLELKGDFQKLVDVAAGVSDVDRGEHSTAFSRAISTRSGIRRRQSWSSASASLWSRKVWSSQKPMACPYRRA
ncbi:MAG: hypothetical protein M5U09_01520 [Gammaproteobacteria bacterium]|nr:hypothetical protein [Gammaproteobacteria bacterium]